MTDPEIRGKSNGRGNGDEAARKVFSDVSGLIHSTLTAQYGVSDPDARAIESELEHWFLRFCRRNPEGGPSAHVVELFSLACSFGSSHERDPEKLREMVLGGDEEDRERAPESELEPESVPHPRGLWERIRRRFGR